MKRACNTQETVDNEIKFPSTSKGISSVTPNTGPTSEKSNTKTQRTSANSWPDDIYNCVNLVSSLPDRAGKNNFLPGSTTWRQKFPADQRSIFVLNLHVHKHILF